MDIAARVGAIARHSIRPPAIAGLWDGNPGWRRLSERVEARILSGPRAVEGEGERIAVPGTSEPVVPREPLVERPRYLLRARDVFMAGQRALIDDSQPEHPRLFNDVLLLPPPFFDDTKPLSSFPHEFRMNAWVRREAETLRLEAPPTPIEIAEPVIAVSSTEIRNYGSWLFRVVPKLLLLEEIEPGDRALFVPTEQPWMRELVSFFAPGRRIVSQDPTRLHHLADVLLPSLVAPANVFPGVVRRRLHALAQAAVAGADRTPLRRIYVSRRRFSERVARRVLLNEAEIAEVFASFGFVEVFPEELSLPDRMALFAEAEIVAGPTGSAMFNTLFCRAKSLVIEIEPHGEFRAMHAALYRSSGLRHTFLRGEVVVASADEAHPDWNISPKLCRKVLDGILREINYS